MNVTSKFRQMYWAKLITVFVAGIFFASMFFSISTMDDGKLNFHYAPTWVAILIIIFLIIEIFLILTLRTISVTDKGIVFKYLFFNKSKIVQYDTILNIEIVRAQQRRSGSIPISDGYHFSALNLFDGKQEIISPDKYDNYSDIINAIRSNMKLKQ
jgi:hypothetical protein